MDLMLTGKIALVVASNKGLEGPSPGNSLLKVLM